jgi:hypothetical protein
MVARARAKRFAALAAALACVVALGSCGGDDNRRLLPHSRATALRATLARVEERAATGDCTQAEQAAATFQGQVTDLSARVDRRLRKTLADGASRLRALVSERCQPKEEEAPATTVPAAPVEPQTGGTTGPEKPGKDKTKDKGAGKDKETPPEQQKPVPDGTDGDQTGGGTLVNPDNGSQPPENVAP